MKSRPVPPATLSLADSQDVTAEQLRLLALQTRTAFIGNLIVMLLLVGAFWNQADHRQLIAWAILLTFTVFLRVFAANGYLQAFPNVLQLRPWKLRITGAILTLGSAWALFVVLFFPTDAPWLLVLVIIMLSGLASASIGSMSSYLPAFMAFTLPMMGTLTFHVFVAGTAVSLVVGIAGLLYMTMCLVWARNIHQTILTSIRLRFENVDLINQLQREKARAEEASETKSRFLAATSHDLRQPLHALNLYLDLLSNEAEREQRRKYLEQAREASAALTTLLDALMDISRLDSDRIQVHIRPFPVQPLLERLHREHVLQARQQGLELRLAKSRGEAETDPMLLERILRNLLSNALRYTRRGKILLGCQSRGNRIRFFVGDTGIGIPVPEQQRIFEEFHQLHNPERDRTKGLGLGLAIVRRLSELISAEVHVHSVPGKGSVFCVDVPRAHALPSDERAALATDPVYSPQHWRILIIDDETAVLRSMHALLERWGHEVTTAETPKQVLGDADLKRTPPDLILCDYRLREGRNGLETLEEIYRSFGRPIPAAILSGDTSPEILERAAERGIPMLPKPVPPARLRALVDTLGRKDGNPSHGV